jgi:hypothetical protein
MSLDCYPLGARRSVDLCEQPIALDVAYDENLLITVVNNCRTIVVFDLEQEDRDNIISEFQLGEDIVVDKVVYSKTGDYIAAVGHNNGRVGLYTAINWRNAHKTSQTKDKLLVDELNLSELTPFDDIDRSDRLGSIDACQRTGNLAASYGDLVVIYQLNEKRFAGDEDQDAGGNCSPCSKSDDQSDNFDDCSILGQCGHHFSHLINIKLTLWASRIALEENYLSIMAVDHVQVLKLEVLTLQIQSDSIDGDGSPLLAGQQQVNRSAGSSGDSHHQTTRMILARKRNGSNAPDTANETTVSGTVSASGDESSGSMVSGLTSNQSTRTNFSSFSAADSEALLVEPTAAKCSLSSATGSSKGGDEFHDHEQTEQQLNCAATIDSDMSIITMNNSNMAPSNQQQLLLLKQQQQQQQAQLQLQTATSAQDDCITWNLNTKKLVKLPTLMHNTSTDLSSFHICHPLELLGPASESIACRVSARIYSADLSQNQLEPVVLLCKQFDFDRDPVKLVQLQAVYLDTNMDEQKRLARGTSTTSAPTNPNSSLIVMADGGGGGGETLPTDVSDSCCRQRSKHPQQLLKSADNDYLAAVCCFVSTLTNCFIYSLLGKKVTRLQTITHPGLCLDLRVDLLNVYLLTPLGLQICSTSICDTTFRHDWSSSADLNLSFIACNRTRVLATKDHLVMISSSSSSSSLFDGRENPESSTSESVNLVRGSSNRMGSFAEVLKKPSLADLTERIVQTVQCCQSISIRSNLLTYLQTSAQLAVIDIERQLKAQWHKQQGQTDKDARVTDTVRHREAIENLKTISLMLARQLLQKKQTNTITNGRIDKTIKHLLDNSYCDLGELMRRHLEALDAEPANSVLDDERGDDETTSSKESDQDRTLAAFQDDDESEDDELLVDGNFELLKIFLRHSKFNQSILDYLKSLLQCDGRHHTGANGSHPSPALFNRVVSYMFDYNPRLLIKCTQRIVRELPTECLSSSGECLEYLVKLLRQLVKLDSTGINRATVLFTLAILHHEMANAVVAAKSSECDQHESESDEALRLARQQQLQEQCLSALSQIKPLNHLAITMCSNHEIIGRSMAKLVNKHHPQVFKLFLNQLQKRGELLAMREFERLMLADNELGPPAPVAAEQLAETKIGLFGRHNTPDASKADEDDEELFEQRLRLLAEISPVELAEFFCRELEGDRSGTSKELDEHNSNGDASRQPSRQAIQAYLKASINLVESKFILGRLCENSR